MRVGMNGMGKLGLPVAYAFAEQGHEVFGYDVAREPYEYVNRRKEYPHIEQGLGELMARNTVQMVDSLPNLVANSELIFVPVQTPHEPKYEGVTRIPEERSDFDYTYLKMAVEGLANCCKQQRMETDISIISTVLPGTINREIRPLLNDKTNLVYNPAFIAMGTVIPDILDPEFTLIGVDDEETADRLEAFYGTIHNKPVFRTDINTAEGIKVFYNTIITAKTVLGNAMGEMAHKLGMSADDIHKALSMATDRIISPKYLKAGVADGGGCHPRDNIALSFVANEIGMSHNIWEDLMKAREEHMEWLADLSIETAKEAKLPLVILGRSFKPETNIETGSPAILMANMMHEKGANPQHYEDIGGIPQKAVYVIGTQHERYKQMTFPKGSTVIDPFRYIEPQKGVTIISIGK